MVYGSLVLRVRVQVIRHFETCTNDIYLGSGGRRHAPAATGAERASRSQLQFCREFAILEYDFFPANCHVEVSYTGILYSCVLVVEGHIVRF